MSFRTIGRIASWEFLARALALLAALDLFLIAPQFWLLFGSRGAIDRTLLIEGTRDLPAAIWRFVPPAMGDAILLALFISAALLAALSTIFTGQRWLLAVLYVVFVILKQSIGLGTYGVHEFLQIGLFYTALWGLFGKSETRAAWIALGLRAHLAMAYLFAGLSKAAGEQWWNGEAIWRSFNRSEASGLRLFDIAALGGPPWVFQAIGVATIVFEGFYFLAFFPKLRPVFCGALIAMHFGTVVFQGLIVFGPTMIALNVFFLLSAAQYGWPWNQPAET